MGQFDIREFGIQEPDTASAAAVKAWDNERDRQVQLNQTNIENERAEKTLEIEERKLGREEWDMMYNNAKNASQRVMVYKSGLNSGVSGLTPSGLSAVEDEALTEFTNKEMLNNYYSASDAGKVELFPKLRSSLINSGNSSDRTIMTQLQKDYETRRDNIAGKEVVDIISMQYPDVFNDATKAFLSGASSISPESVNLFGSMVKTHLDAKNVAYKTGMSAAEKLINRPAPGIDATEFERKQDIILRQMGMSMMAELRGLDEDEEDDDLFDIPKPTLENLDEILTGKDNSYDKLHDKRKIAIFNKVVKKHAANWSTMSDAEKVEAGEKIEAEINKTSYDIAPQEAGLFGKFADPEYKGAESITNEMIDVKFEEILKRRGIVGNRKSMASKETLKEVRDLAESELLKEMREKSRKKAKKVARRGYPPHGKYSFIYDK